MIFIFKAAFFLRFLIYMISTCALIDKYTFYEDFKGVLSSTPKVSVVKSDPSLSRILSSHGV
jgi:hypothetical protein